MSKVTIIRAATLIDGTGAPPLANAAVLVKDGLIEAVGSAADLLAPQGEVEIVDGGQGCLLPGLIDTHVHLCFSTGPDVVGDLLKESDERLMVRATHNAQVALAAGITALRDCGGRHQVALILRDAINAGIVAGSRIFACGMPITTTAGHCHYFGLQADNADEVRKAARALVRDGVDFFKVMATGGNLTPISNSRRAQYSVKELGAIMEEARRLNKKVAAHVLATEGVRNAAEVGVDTLEHCAWLGQNGLEFDYPTLEKIAEKRLFIGPTLVAGVKAFQAGILMTPDRKLTFMLREERKQYHRQAVQMGVRMIAGTDAGVPLTPFDSVASHLELMVSDLGMAPVDAIATATGNSALAMGADGEIGTLKAGRRADLILVDGNPAQDITALRRVRRVWKDGKLAAEDGKLVIG